jgi:hypothetical protein
MKFRTKKVHIRNLCTITSPGGRSLFVFIWNPYQASNCISDGINPDNIKVSFGHLGSTYNRAIARNIMEYYARVLEVTDVD